MCGGMSLGSGTCSSGRKALTKKLALVMAVVPVVVVVVMVVV